MTFISYFRIDWTYTEAQTEYCLGALEEEWFICWEKETLFLEYLNGVWAWLLPADSLLLKIRGHPLKFMGPCERLTTKQKLPRAPSNRYKLVSEKRFSCFLIICKKKKLLLTFSINKYDNNKMFIYFPVLSLLGQLKERVESWSEQLVWHNISFPEVLFSFQARVAH